MSQDADRSRAPAEGDVTQQWALVLGALLSLSVLIGLALITWLEHAT